MEGGRNDSFSEGHSEGEIELHFFYNREERLKKAPSSVQNYYSGKFKLNKGFRALVATKANRFMLFALAVCLVCVMFTTVLTSANRAKLAGMSLTLSSFAFEEEIFVSLKIEKSKTESEIPVQMTVWCVDIDGQKSEPDEISGIFNGKELFLRTRFPDYDIMSVLVEVSSLGQTQKLEASVQRR